MKIKKAKQQERETTKGLGKFSQLTISAMEKANIVLRFFPRHCLFALFVYSLCLFAPRSLSGLTRRVSGLEKGLCTDNFAELSLPDRFLQDEVTSREFPFLVNLEDKDDRAAKEAKLFNVHGKGGEGEEKRPFQD